MKNIIIDIHDDIINNFEIFEIPFILTSPKQPINFIKYLYENNCQKQFIKISRIQFSLPHIVDYNVLISLLNLSLNNNLQVNFSFNDLAKIIGYKYPSGIIIHRIKYAINALLETNININDSICFSILSEVNYSLTNSTTKNLNHIIFNKYFYDSINEYYKKYFNYELYQQLNNGIAKRIFPFLNRKRNNNTKLTLPIETLYNLIPHLILENKYKKESIKRALYALITVNFIQSFEIHNNIIECVF